LIGYLVKINERVAESVGHPYFTYLGRIFVDLLGVYKLYSEYISSQLALAPESSSNSLIKGLKTVRRDILKLVETFIKNSTDQKMIVNDFLPSLSPLIVDYNGNIPNAK
jgi:exportin-1